MSGDDQKVLSAPGDEWDGSEVTEATAIPRSTGKGDVLAELGEQRLLIPSMVGAGLEANERAKYLLSLLQAARSRADAPAQPWSSLRAERRSAGVADPGLDRVVERSAKVGPDLYLIPQAGAVHRDLARAIGQVLAPLEEAQLEDAPPLSRLEALLATVPDLGGDRVPGSYIDRITSARRDAGDSLHLLVMDAHRALNRLQAQVATDMLDGAMVYGLADADRDLVGAFMAGLHSTAPLRLDHPGLGTTATRVGSRILIQNDLGTTEAHVVVIAVEGLTATMTYTDVHMARLRFLVTTLEGFDVSWSHIEHRHGGPLLGAHHVTTGRYEAPDRVALANYLHRVGSRLVFVLDWNRARKRLTTFLPRKDAVELLRWAADNNVGHMAFLALGGPRLIYDAVELAAKVPARYGEPLIDVLGRDATLAITRFALRAASDGLLAGKSAWLIRDELRVEVLRHVQASHRRLLDDSAEHASLIVETAQALHAALSRLCTADGETFLHRTAERAAGWEHRADEILIAQRQAARRVDGGQALIALTGSADDAIDALEEAIFLLTLLPKQAIDTVRPIMDPVAAIAVATAREHLKSVEIARQVVDSPGPDDLEDFIVAVDQVATLEHEADTADRMARAALVTEAPDFRSLYVADSVSRTAEVATDAMLRSVLGLRDHVLSRTSTP